MNKDLEILKRLLAEADEDEATEETPKEDDKETKEEKPKKGSFEADPMGFILKKYHSLNELMEELMTSAFKEYVDGIFLMAPKPTTFKVLLHNGQYFFLTYLGVPNDQMKSGVYEATIEGKRYYLAGIGEKERCMMAIARLLRFGTPLKTKGPDGAEQGTRENTGMEGDWAEKTGEMAAAGAAGGAAAAAEETPETGEEPAGEELAESLDIIKALLIREAVQPTADLHASLVKGLGGKSESKKGKHIRANLGGEKDAIDAISKSLAEMGFKPKDVKIETIQANEFSKGAKSGSFVTYKVTAMKDLGNVKKGQEAFIVSTVKEGKSTITGKALTPTAMGLDGKTFKTPQAIAKAVTAKTSNFKDKNLSIVLDLLMKDVIKASKKRFDSISEVKDYEESIPLSKETIQVLSGILPADLNNIGKDFGEILGALLISGEVDLVKGITFPGGATAQLTDFFADGYGISSKYKKGAAATLPKIISEVDPENLTTKSQKQLHNILQGSFQNKPVSNGYVYLAKQLKIPAVEVLAKTLGVKPENITLQAINDEVLQTIKKKPSKESPEADAALNKKFGAFFSAAGSKPASPINWGKITTDKKLYGLITSPLAAATAKYMNEYEAYTKALKEIIGKVEVKQLYLDFNLGKKTMAFKLKSFSDPKANFKFVPSNVSAYNPDNGNMGFMMK